MAVTNTRGSRRIAQGSPEVSLSETSQPLSKRVRIFEAIANLNRGFDRVLADVPCSGLGALRRRAEARWRRSPADVTALGPVQRALLVSALDSARPGGVVAYVTCSPHLAETRDVVTSVLARRDDAEVLDAPAVLPEVPGLRCPDPHPEFAQFWPHRHGTDAIFIALLRRRKVR